MLLAVIASLAILGMALLIKSMFSEKISEFRNPFFYIIGIFTILYIGAALFVSYRIQAYSAGAQDQTFNINTSNYSVSEPVTPVDLSTP